jgi:chaperonin GroEL (HSP60 family)
MSGTLDVGRVKTIHSIQMTSVVIEESDNVQREHARRVVTWLRSLQVQCVFLQWGLSSMLRDVLHQAGIGTFTHILAHDLERVALYTGAQILTHIPRFNSNSSPDSSSSDPHARQTPPPPLPPYVGFLDNVYSVKHSKRFCLLHSRYRLF